MRTLQGLCLSSYLSFLERECKVWIDLTSSGSYLLQNVSTRILPALQCHLSEFLSGTASSNLRGLMFEEILSGKYPSSRYRSCTQGLSGDFLTNLETDNVHRVYEDLLQHTPRCARLCCTGVFIVEAMLKVVINDELRELSLPENLSERIWHKKNGGIETLIPFHYPALLSCYTKSVLLSPSNQRGSTARQPALTKLKIGKIDTIEKLHRNLPDRIISFPCVRQYLDFMKYLAPRQKLFSGVPMSVFDWPGEDKSGVLPTRAHAAFATKSIFDMFSPKSLGNVGKFGHLTEICLNNTESLQSWDLRGIELISAIGKSVPRLVILDLSGVYGLCGELLLYLLFQDAFQSLHQLMYLHKYRVPDLEERDALEMRTGQCRAVLRDLESLPRPHSYDVYCPWCLDEGAYHDNLRTGCSQEFYPITVVDDRLWHFVETMMFNDALQARSLLHCVTVSDLISSLTSPTMILTRNSPLLPYETGFKPEPNTEHLGEWDGSEYPGLWFPPSVISYEGVDDAEWRVRRMNPLVNTLQVLRVPTSSRSLWGEIIPFILTACPSLKTLGKASGSMYGLELMDGLGVTSGLEEVFLHLDWSPQDSLLPRYTQLCYEGGATLEQNAPSLQFLVQNFGSTIFQPVLESDDQATVIKKEFALEIWDHAKFILPYEDTAIRMARYIDLLVRRAPRMRSLHILTLYRSSGLEIPWDRLQDLAYLTQLILRVPYLADYAGLFGAIGHKLKKVRVVEFTGETEDGEMALVEGINMEEQGALFVCEKCPNAVELDLISVNFTTKFFFGRQLIRQPCHFHQLTSLYVGKIDWDTFKQVWCLCPSMIKLQAAAILRAFAINDQTIEEGMVVTTEQVRELHSLNERIWSCLEEVLVSTFRFATLSDLDCFVSKFSGQFRKLGRIDTKHFREIEMVEMMENMKLSRKLEIECCDEFN